MAKVTYDRPLTALLVIDPYNERLGMMDRSLWVPGPGSDCS
jgi:hypothetical protein